MVDVIDSRKSATRARGKSRAAAVPVLEPPPAASAGDDGNSAETARARPVAARKPRTPKWRKPWPAAAGVLTRKQVEDEGQVEGEGTTPAVAEVPAPEAVTGPLPDFPDAVWLLSLWEDETRKRAATVLREPDPCAPPQMLLSHAARAAGGCDEATLLELKAIANAPEDPKLDTPLRRSGDEFTEEEVVYLHWRMLEAIKCLADPKVSLLERFSVLAWVFTDDPEADAKPFSFAQCVEVVTRSPLTNVRGLPYVGRIDPGALRDKLESEVRRRWMVGVCDGYPLWLRINILQNPDFYLRQLERDPQWINKQLKRMSRERDALETAAPAVNGQDAPGAHAASGAQSTETPPTAGDRARTATSVQLPLFGDSPAFAG